MLSLNIVWIQEPLHLLLWSTHSLPLCHTAGEAPGYLAWWAEASQCLLPCVQDRHPTYFFWTDKYCANKALYALHLRMKAQPSHSRSQIHKAEKSSGHACMSSSLTWPTHLLNPIIGSTPEAAAHYKPEASIPLHKAKKHLKYHLMWPINKITHSSQWRSDGWDQIALRHLDLAKQCHPNQVGQFKAGSPWLLAAEVYPQQLSSTSRK